MSDSVVVGPRLTRTAPRASAGATPMAASTCEGWTLPDEQAAPEDTATPSRSKAMTAVSAFMPGTANRVVLGRRSLFGAENDRHRGCGALRPRLQAVAQRCHMRAVGRQVTLGGGSSEAAMLATFSVPARAPRSWPPPRSAGSRCSACVALDQRARRPSGRRSCAQKSSEESAPSTLISICIRPAPWTASTCRSAACRMHQGRHLRDRLNNPGLVIGQHDRNERPRPALSCSAASCRASAARSILPFAVTGSRLTASAVKRPPASTEGCSMARHQQGPRGDWLRPTAPRPGRKHQHIGFGATGGEHHIARLGPDQRGDLLARLLDHRGGRRGPRHGPRTDCRTDRAPRPWRLAPADAEARSHSSRDRPASTLLSTTIARSRPVQTITLDRTRHAL